MKPQSLQDAIKAAALKKKSRIESGQWKEPQVKQVKVTAEDMKNSEKATSGGSRQRCSGGMMVTPPASSVDTVLRKELDLLKKQMLDLQASMSTTSPQQSTLSPQTRVVVAKDTKEAITNQRVQVLEDKVIELGGIIREMKELPDAMRQLRESVIKSLDDQRHLQQNTSPLVPATRVVDVDDFEALQSEVISLRAAMKKQKGEFDMELETTLSKVYQQEKTILQQQGQIEALRNQVQEALQIAQMAMSQTGKAVVNAPLQQPQQPDHCAIPLIPPHVSQQTTTRTSSPIPQRPSPSPTPVSPTPASPHRTASVNEDGGPPKSIIISPRKSTLSPKKKSYLSPRKKSVQPTSNGEGNAQYSSPKKKSVNDNEVRLSLSPKKKSSSQDSDSRADTNKAASAESENGSTCALPVKKDLVNDSSHAASDSCLESSRPSLPQIPKTDSSDSSDSEVNDTKDKPQRRQNPRRFEAHAAPERPRRDEEEGSDEEGDGDIEIDIDDEEKPSGQQASAEQHNGEGGNFARRGSLDSVQTWDTMDSAPRKKIISLLPHKSIDIYEEQRKDNILRKLMMKGKTQNMKVRKVHGKNLVFFSDRVYIPAPLRQKTLEFYWKKYRKHQTPLLHLEKNCFWADIENEWKRFEAEKRTKPKTYSPVQLTIL